MLKTTFDSLAKGERRDIPIYFYFSKMSDGKGYDTKFKGLLIGVVIGLFTIDEYLMYIKNTSSLNRRMISMLIERLKNQLQLI